MNINVILCKLLMAEFSLSKNYKISAHSTILFSFPLVKVFLKAELIKDLLSLNFT